MANFVTKKDGTRVPFEAEKIKDSIMAAATDAELSEQDASAVAEEVSPLVLSAFESQEEVSSKDIKEKILSELDVSHPNIAQAWRTYEESKGE